MIILQKPWATKITHPKAIQLCFSSSHTPETSTAYIFSCIPVAQTSQSHPLYIQLCFILAFLNFWFSCIAILNISKTHLFLSGENYSKTSEEHAAQKLQNTQQSWWFATKSVQKIEHLTIHFLSYYVKGRHPNHQPSD